MSRSVCRKSFILLGLSVLLPVVPAFTQDSPAVRENLWVCSSVESNLYSLSGAAFGGGVALGYGDGVAFGLKVIYSRDTVQLETLELDFLLRFYLPRLTGHSGLFIQLEGGPVIFAQDSDTLAVPSGIGTISAGLNLGWRFLLGRSFFIEPAVRGGYPCIAGVVLSAGVHF